MKQRQLIAKSVALIVFAFTWVVQAQDRPETDELFYLDSKYSMDLPASLLEITTDENGKESGQVLTYEDQYFAPGTKFSYSGYVAVGSYGDSFNNSKMPLVFVYPVDENGVVDYSITLGFPAQFLINAETKKKASEYSYLQTTFNEEYKKAGTTPAAETKGLEGYLSFVSRMQQADTKIAGGVPATGADVASAAHTPSPTVAKPVVERPRLSFSPSVTDENKTADAPAETPRVSEDAPAIPVLAKPDEVKPVDDGLNADNVYYNDPRLRSAVQVRTSESLSSVILEVKNEDGSNRYLRRTIDIPQGTRFIPILWKEDSKRDKSSQEMVRWFYKIDADGNIATNESGEREVYILPLNKLSYKDPIDGKIKRVSEATKLYSGSTSVAAKPEADVAADEVASEKPVVIPSPVTPAKVLPARPISKTPEAKIVVAPVVKPIVEKDQNDLLPANALALTECGNQNFADELSKAGEECRLVEIENFQLVKSQLIQQLKGENAPSSVLLNSGVIAIDKSTKMCSKIDVTHEAYVDDSRAQAKINEYKQNMTDAYKKIVSSIHTNKSGRIGAAFPSAPKESTHTYSCERNQSSCRYSYDFYTPEKLPLVNEITMYADDLSQQEKIKVYGPTEDNKYLVIFKRGGQDVRTLVLQDNPGLILNGPVGKLLKEMKAFESDYKYSRLSDIQKAYNSEKLNDSAMGHFISSETVYPNGQKQVLKERLGAPASLALIGKIRQNKTFYELKCRFNPLERKTALPKWDEGTEGVH
jgi:hypothetical protein